MKKQILLFMALCLMLSVNATTWTVINNNAVVATNPEFVTDVYSGSLQYCVANSADGDIVNFDASLSDAKIEFNDSLKITKQLTIDATSLANPVKFDGKSTVNLLRYTPDINNGVKELILRGITFQNAKSNLSASGGVLSINNNYVIEKCNFLNNVNTIAADAGGPACIYNFRKSSSFQIRDCVFNGNISGGNGSVMLSTSQNGIIERCYFTANKARVGSVLYTKNAAQTVNDYIEFRNCTMVANEGTTNVDGNVIAMAQNTSTSGYLRVINCTVYGNIIAGTLGKGAIYSAYRKIEFGGCLSGKNNGTSNNATDFKTYTGGEALVSLGYNVYHKVTSINVHVTTPATNDINYTNASWDTAPLASAVNAQGVMEPIQIDELLFTTNIQRIPKATIETWHGVSAVDQLGTNRSTDYSSVGARHATGTSTATHKNEVNKLNVFASGNVLHANYLKGSDLKLYTSTGQLICQDMIDNDFFTKDISGLNNGIYFVRFYDNVKKVSSFKIIK